MAIYIQYHTIMQITESIFHRNIKLMIYEYTDTYKEDYNKVVQEIFTIYNNHCHREWNIASEPYGMDGIEDNDGVSDYHLYIQGCNQFIKRSVSYKLQCLNYQFSKSECP
jgi:hypothetical protein